MIYSNSNYVVRHSCCVAIIDLQVKAIIVCKYFCLKKITEIFFFPFGLGILTVISHVALKMIF